MPRVVSLLDAVAFGLCETAWKPLSETGRWVDVLPDVARAAYDAARRDLGAEGLRDGLRQLLQLRPEDYRARLADGLDRLEAVHPVPFRAALAGYLEPWPRLLKAHFRRPSDPTGLTLPEAFRLASPEDFLPLLPSRLPAVAPGREPKGLENWKLVELLGFGELTETWRVEDSQHPERNAVLKFVTDHEAADDLRVRQDLFLEAFRLVNETGVVPLRSVYLETDPPAIETAFLDAYNLGALLREWQGKYAAARVGSSLKLVRRIAEIVGKAHRKGVVHRDLKPTNILLSPTQGERFTLWVSEFGWSQLAAARSVALARGGTPAAEQDRLARRGAHSALFASPQFARREAPDPRDDVFAIGAIWHQLLRRDPGLPPPSGHHWIETLLIDGVPEVQVDLLRDCLSPRPDKRPADALELAAALAKVGKGSDSGRHFPLRSGSEEYISLPLTADPKSGVALAATPKPGPAGAPRYLTNTLGMTFALVPPGQFRMGSAPGEIGHQANEEPVHPVTITRPFHLGAFLVTQGQYERVMGRNPSFFTKARGGGPDHPVDTVSWNDAAKFCDRLSELPDEEAKGRIYRLPTEAEWEYACRAGTQTAFAFGDRITTKTAHFATGLAFDKSGGVARTAPVGSMPPNAFGLYDMHGNLQEWVNDWYGAYYYQDSPAEDPPGPATGTDKVIRGGCYTMFGIDLRSASRKFAKPGVMNATIGLRVVMVAPRGKG
jgi:formylglycine-generating enzyme required for sulfatase activity